MSIKVTIYDQHTGVALKGNAQFMDGSGKGVNYPIDATGSILPEGNLSQAYAVDFSSAGYYSQSHTVEELRGYSEVGIYLLKDENYVPWLRYTVIGVVGAIAWKFIKPLLKEIRR